jgi:hypothetical protein
MFRHRRGSKLSAFVIAAVVAGQLGQALPAAAQPAPPPAPPSAPSPQAAQPAEEPVAAPALPDATPEGVTAAPKARAHAVPDLGPINPGPDGHVAVNRQPSKALQDIPPLPATNPAPGQVPVQRADVLPDPPVRPTSLDLPHKPAQDLVDATAADALSTLGDAGRLTQDGRPDLDATKLQPQVSSAQVVDPTRPATLQELVDALLSGNIPPPLPIDPLALLQQLPDGLPRITYRICSESPGKPVSCSLTLPLAVPAIVDVTGDRSPDLLADLVPAAGVGDIVAAAKVVLGLQQQIRAATDRLADVIELLKDPLNVILHPELLVEKLNLEGLLEDLGKQLADALTALVDLVQLGLGLLSVRLPTSEHAGEDLPAHVWAVYDLPTHKRISVGFDGMRRGTSMPTAAVGLYTFSPLRALRGIFDIKATLITVGAGDSLAITAGLAGVEDDDEGRAFDPTVASARFAPVPNLFTAHALIDPGADDRDQKATIDATSSVRSQLDTQVLSNKRGDTPVDRFDQLKVDVLPTSVSADLTRPPGGEKTTVDYAANATIENALFADYTYSGGTRLDQAMQAKANQIPATWHAELTNPQDKINLDYTASGRLAGLDADFYDRDPAIVGRGSLRALPDDLSLLVDRAAKHVNFTGAQALGSASAAFAKNLSDYAPLDGDHATVLTDGEKIGASARVTGMRVVDAYYDGHPRLNTTFDPGGQAFTAGGDIDGVHKARLEISNLPHTASIDADTANHRVRYEASEVIERAHVGYTNTQDGPTLAGSVFGVPTDVQLDYELGEKPHFVYTASSRIPRVELFASDEHIETVRPSDDHYVSALTLGVPTKVDLLVDLAAKHLQGELAEGLDSVTAVVRLPVGGRDWTATAAFAGVPTQFDADWADGNLRFRGQSGPLAAATLWVSNHGGATLPTGLHLAVHYRESTGNLDAGVRVRNLSLVQYSREGDNQSFDLQTDTGGDPVFVDADVTLGNPDDIKLAALGRIDNLPSTVDVEYGAGKLSYRADRNVGIALGVRVGKIAALDGLGAPLFGNGVAAVARGCDTGAGCAKDDTPFCGTFARCLGLAGSINLPGLPTEVTVDLAKRTAVLTDYRPPAGEPLQAYVRAIGLIDTLPDFRALATLSGLPTPVDLTVGPISVGSGKPTTVDVGYTASAPLGTLQVDVDASTTNADFPVVRGRARIGTLPASAHVTGTLGDQVTLAVRDSAPIDELSLRVTGADTGYVDASATGIPAEADVLLDFPAKHADVTTSSQMSRITALARNIPVAGQRWSAFAELRDLPSHVTADWADGSYKLAADPPLGSAAVAVTNHEDATAPSGPHLAFHSRESTGTLDASALLTGLKSASYTREGDNQAFALNMGAARIAIDGNVVLGKPDDVRLAAAALLDTPNTLHVDITEGKLAYSADRQVGLLAEAAVGKVAALDGLGAPLFDNGIAARARGCAPGSAGCKQDESPFCTIIAGRCLGLVATVNLPGLPKTVTVDLKTKQVDLTDYQPRGGRLDAYVALDGLVPKVPHAAGMVTLDGLPSTMDLTVGPFAPAGADPRGFDFAYDAHVPLGSVTAKVEASTDDYGTVYGLAQLSNTPAKVTVHGLFGSKSTVDVQASQGIGELVVATTADLDGKPASGRLDVTGVPARINLELTGFGKEGVGAPTIAYKATDAGGQNPVSTLDGNVTVEAALIEAFSVGGVKIPLAGDAFAGFTDLGATTTVKLNEDTSIVIDSTPQTGSLDLGASVHTKYDTQPLNVDLFDKAGFTGTLTGHYGVPKLDIEDFQLTLSGIRKLELRPGAKLSYLTTGLRGDFDSIKIAFGGLTIEPDVLVHLHIANTGPDVYDEDLLSLGKDDTVHGVRFHLADQVMRPSGKPIDLGVACVRVSTLPGQFATGENAITIDGTPGEEVVRTLNYADPIPTPGGIDPALVSMGLDLLTVYYTHPFDSPPAEASYDVGAGGC